jgi:DNA replication ATP-dependent helicase Dna2
MADRHVESSGSPLQRRAQEQDDETSDTMQGQDEFVEEDTHMEEQDAAQEPARSFGSSDDFGDDDFDDMVDTLDISPQTVQQPVQLVQPQQQMSYTTIPTEPIQPPRQQESHAIPQSKAADSDDEFGMSEDEDGFAADLEQVASLYDTRPVVSQHTAGVVTETQNQAATRMSAPTTPIIDLVDDDEDDEFGDEIDADEFAAAEVAATQPPANTVRRTP